MSNVQPPPGNKLREHKSYGRVAPASAMWAYLRAGAQALIAIPITIMLARTLAPEELGIAAAAVFFAQLAARLSSGGMGSALVRLKELRPEHISTMFTFNAALMALSVGALMAAAPLVGPFYGRPEVGWLLAVVSITFALSAALATRVVGVAYPDATGDQPAGGRDPRDSRRASIEISA